MKITNETKPTDNPIFQFLLDSSLLLLSPLLYGSFVVRSVVLSGVVSVLLLGVSVFGTDKGIKYIFYNKILLEVHVLLCLKTTCKQM